MFVRSPTSCDTDFQKYKKNIFLSLLVSVWPARVVWHIFSSNSKIPKEYKIFKIEKHQHFQTSLFLELRDPWFSIVRYVAARPILVRFTSKRNQIFFSIVLQISFKEIRNPDFSSLMRIRRTNVNPCRAQKLKKKYFCFF